MKSLVKSRKVEFEVIEVESQSVVVEWEVIERVDGSIQRINRSVDVVGVN